MFGLKKYYGQREENLALIKICYASVIRMQVFVKYLENFSCKPQFQNENF